MTVGERLRIVAVEVYWIYSSRIPALVLWGVYLFLKRFNYRLATGVDR